MSRQKERHLKRTPREDMVIERIREFSESAYIDAIENHFAGMWNELGFQITVKPETADADVIKLRNEVLTSFDDMNSKDPLPFTWIVSFIRSGKSIEVLVPGNKQRDINDTLYPL